MDYKPPFFKKSYEFCYVWLRRNNDLAHLFRCPQCGSPVMRYQGQAIALIPAGDEALSTAAAMSAGTITIMNFPMETRCTNKNCPARYVFEGFTI